MGRICARTWQLARGSVLLLLLSVLLLSPSEVLAQDALEAQAGASVHGRVTVAVTGEPVPSAYVYLYYLQRDDEWGDQWWHIDTAYGDENGFFSFTYDPGMELPPGEYVVEVDARGYYLRASAPSYYDGTSALEINVELEPQDLAFSGTVTDASTGEPIESAEVFAEYYEEWYDEWDDQWYAEWYWADSTYADASGAYELYVGWADEYRVTAAAYRYQSASAMVTYDGANPVQRAFALQLREPEISGTVTDADTGEPIESAEVFAEYYEEWYDEWDDQWYAEWYWADYTQTDEAGAYKLYVGWADEYRVTAAAYRYQSASAMVTYDGANPVQRAFALQLREPEISGTVTDADTGEPIESAEVFAEYYEEWYDEWDDQWYAEWYWADYTQTDEAGAYELYVGWADEYRVTAAAYRYQTASAMVTYDGANPVQQDFALAPKRLALRGVVSDADSGVPLKSSSVTILAYDEQAEGWYEIDRTWTDADGEYELYLAQAGQFDVMVSRRGYEPVEDGFEFDGSTTVKRDFALQPKSPAVSGIVRDSVTLQPVKGAWVEAYYEMPDQSEAYWDYAQSGADGSYTLYLDVAAEYEMWVAARGYSHATGTIVYDGMTLSNKDFALDPMAAAVTGTVTSAASDDPIAGAWVWAEYWDDDIGEWFGDWAETGPDGSYALYLDHSADYQMGADARGYVGADGVAIFDGLTPVQKDFALMPIDPTATGVVTDSVTMQPLEGASVYLMYYDNFDKRWWTMDAMSTYANGSYTLFKDDLTVDDPDNWRIDAGRKSYEDYRHTFPHIEGSYIHDFAMIPVSTEPGNTAPVATNDAYAATEGVALSVPAPGVLANDTDADGDPLTAHLLTNVSNGTLVLQSDGSFLYTPAAGFVGTDTFTYRAYDGTAYSARPP
jgi:5-hydroxyisourate hydrolase-like protein (transthyretin family)